MEEKEPATKDSIEYLLEAILSNNTSFAHAPVEISASPEEEGPSYTRVHPYQAAELRAAIIKLTTQMADDRALTMQVQN